MNQETTNICPICGEKNPISNEQCFKCNFKFLEQEELFLTAKDRTEILELLEENIAYFKAKITFFHNLGGDTDIREAKNSLKETLRRIKELHPYFNNSVLFDADTKEMLNAGNLTEEYKKFLRTLGVETEELSFAINENMNYEEYRRRTLTKLGALCFSLMDIKKRIELGKICYLTIKTDKEFLINIEENITSLLKEILGNSSKDKKLPL
jgi:hypothetical protein